MNSLDRKWCEFFKEKFTDEKGIETETCDGTVPNVIKSQCTQSRSVIKKVRK